MQFVRMVNADTRPYDYHHHQKKQVIQPGADRVVPWDLACSLFGDPTVIDTQADRARTRALKQARGQHNYALGQMTDDEWERIRPKIEVYDLETGARVYMVMEDPDGEKSDLNPQSAGQVTNDLEALQRQIMALTAQVARLVGQQTGQASPAAIGDQNSPTVTADDPGPTMADLAAAQALEAELAEQFAPHFTLDPDAPLNRETASEDTPQAVSFQGQTPRLAPRP